MAATSSCRPKTTSSPDGTGRDRERFRRAARRHIVPARPDRRAGSRGGTCSGTSWNGRGRAIMTPSPCSQAPRWAGWRRPPRLILRDPDRADEAVQETMVRCWRDLPTLRDPDRFEAWLHRLFLNACRDELRTAEAATHRGRAPRDHPPRRGATASRSRLTGTTWRVACVAWTPSNARSSSFTTTWACRCQTPLRRCGSPLGTAKSRLHRAIRALRAALDADARVTRDGRGGMTDMTATTTSTASSWPGSTTSARVRRRGTSRRCSSGRAACGSGRPGPASKGGSP